MQRGQRTEQRAFRAVIAPQRYQHLPDALRHAGREGVPRALDAEMIEGDIAVGFARAGGKDDVGRDLQMRAEHGVVVRLVKAVIIPVNQRRIVGYAPAHRRVYGAVRPVILAAPGQAEEHVAPQHRPEAIAPGQQAHAFKMPQKQLRAVGIAVLLQIAAQPQHVRLVHADVDVFRAEAAAQLGKDRLDQPLRPLLVQQQDVVNIHIIAHGVPLEGLLHVRQRLNGGNQLDPQRRGVAVQRRQLVVRIALPPIAEIGIVLQREHVLHIQLQRAVAHPRQHAQQPLYALHARHSVARAVQHGAQTFKGGLLPQGKACLFGAVRLRQPNRPPRHPRLRQLRQPAVLLLLQHNAVCARHKADILRRAQLLRDPAKIQRLVHDILSFLSEKEGAPVRPLLRLILCGAAAGINSPFRPPFH